MTTPDPTVVVNVHDPRPDDLTAHWTYPAGWDGVFVTLPAGDTTRVTLYFADAGTAARFFDAAAQRIAVLAAEVGE